MTKSLLFLENLINDVPLSNLKRQEAFAHLAEIQNTVKELSEKHEEIKEKIEAHKQKAEQKLEQQHAKAKK